MLCRSIVNKGLWRSRRHHDVWQDFPLSPLLECYQCARQDEHISYGSNGTAVPPFGCTFSTELHSVLAVSNEEGIVRLYDSDRDKNQVLKANDSILQLSPHLQLEEVIRQVPKKEWMAHDNAVFDIAWVPGESKLVTASGDQMAKLWDVKAGEMLGIFKGHQCSLKSVSFTRQEKAVFCTGGRDGNIMIWDMRCSKKDGYYRQVKQISGAHNKVDRHTPFKTKRRKLTYRGMAPSVDSQQSVTVVLFRDENTLISSGAVDGTIKVWDLRKNYTAHHHDPVPLQMYLYPGSSTRRLGYSGLTVDSSGSRLFANCIDDNIYMFNLTGLKTTPVTVFNGHLNSSFYVKSSVSPDDQFLASGSSDHHGYIWKISDPKSSPLMLQGHSDEVTSVAWCPTDFTKIASCSDDNTVRIWRLNRRPSGMKSSAGEDNLVGWACPKPLLEAQCSSSVQTSEITPTKSPRGESLGVLMSPQAASCAPNGAELPLPSTTSNTPSPPSSKTPPVGSPRQSRSIWDWIAHTPGSPKVRSPWMQGTSPLKEMPSTSCQSGSQRWAKRRLETAAEGQLDSTEDGTCDTELAPPVKRERSLDSGCHQILEDQEHWREGEVQMVKQDEVPTSSRRANKENNIPGGADWLSALGQKLRRGSVSPSHSRTASVSKKQAQCSPRSMKKISSYFQRGASE